jgi:outer membrane protein assembly factor BamB
MLGFRRGTLFSFSLALLTTRSAMAGKVSARPLVGDPGCDVASPTGNTSAAFVRRHLHALFPPSPGAPTAPWAMYGHDAQHSGRSPYVGPSGPFVCATWTAGFGTFSSPAVGADGTVYTVSSVDGYLYALDGASGTVKWNTTFGVYADPAVGADGTVYTVSADGYLYALDGALGTLKWNYSQYSGVYESPSPVIGPDGTVYIGPVVVDGASGALKRNYTNVGRLCSSPAIGSDGTVYIVSYYNEGSALNALDGASGALKWNYTIGNSDSGPAIGADGTVYIVSADNTENALNALDGASGALKWNYTIGYSSDFSLAIGADGTVYVVSADNKVYALNAVDGTSGALKWKFATGGALYYSPAIGGDGTVYIGSSYSYLYALDGASGALKWKFITGLDTGVSSNPAIGTDGTLYLGIDSSVYAIRDCSQSATPSPYSSVSATQTASSCPIPACRSGGCCLDGSPECDEYCGCQGRIRPFSEHQRWAFGLCCLLHALQATGFTCLWGRCVGARCFCVCVQCARVHVTCLRIKCCMRMCACGCVCEHECVFGLCDTCLCAPV